MEILQLRKNAFNTHDQIIPKHKKKGKDVNLLSTLLFIQDINRIEVFMKVALNGYDKILQIQSNSKQSNSFKVSKKNKEFYMKQFLVYNQSHENELKVLEKFRTSKHVLGVIDHFEENDRMYWIKEYVPASLQSQMNSKNGKKRKIFLLADALQYFSQVVTFMKDCHQNSYILRQLLPQKIRMNSNKIYFSDFSQIILQKRKRKIFQKMNDNFASPEYASSDGYDFHTDVWAAGILLYYMLVGSYPFNLQGKSIEQINKVINTNISKGFDYAAHTKAQGHYAGQSIYNEMLKNLFSKIFCEQKDRIELEQLSSHPLLKLYFQKPFDMSSIWQAQHEQSIMYSSIKINSKWTKYLHKEQAILDFIERTSQGLTICCTEIFNNELRFKVRLGIMKMALIRCNKLSQSLYGRGPKPADIDDKDWQKFRKSSTGEMMKKKMEKKYNYFLSIFKASRFQISAQKLQDNILFNDGIPTDFPEIKNHYRQQLSKMYHIVRLQLKKSKNQERSYKRQLTEILVKIVIFYLINRIFQNEEMQNDFIEYYVWSKFKDLEDLQTWIENDKIQVLQSFALKLINKYLTIEN